jgi:hypothetical protein
VLRGVSHIRVTRLTPERHTGDSGQQATRTTRSAHRPLQRASENHAIGLEGCRSDGWEGVGEVRQVSHAHSGW